MSQEPLAATTSVAVIPASYPLQGITLKLKRAQRSGLLGKVIFTLDARIALNAEDAELIRKYRLGDDVIYESSNRKQQKEATMAHLEMTKSTGAGKTLYRLARAGVSATAAALSLKITINSLSSGVHVECKSIAELMEAETAIVEAAGNVRNYLELAETFDGREEVLEF